jgi:hypothetical protein
VKRKFDGTFEGAAFDDSALDFDGILSRVNPEVLGALGVILAALIERRAKKKSNRPRASRQRAREARRWFDEQQKRISRAVRAVKTRRKNAKKKRKVTRK